MTQEKYTLKMKQLTDLLIQAENQGAVLMVIKIKNIMQLLTTGFNSQNK